MLCRHKLHENLKCKEELAWGTCSNSSCLIWAALLLRNSQRCGSTAQKPWFSQHVSSYFDNRCFGGITMMSGKQCPWKCLRNHRSSEGLSCCLWSSPASEISNESWGKQGRFPLVSKLKSIPSSLASYRHRPHDSTPRPSITMSFSLDHSSLAKYLAYQRHTDNNSRNTIIYLSSAGICWAPWRGSSWPEQIWLWQALPFPHSLCLAKLLEYLPKAG